MEDKEFKEMREQIGILKNKLDKESIVNDRMMRNVLNTKVDSLRRKKKIEMTCALLVIVLGPMSFYQSFGCSWEFIAFTDVVMLFCMYMNHRVYAPVTKRDLMSGNLLEVSKLMARFKDQMKQWILYISLPLGLLWVGLLEWEIYNSSMAADKPEYIHGLMISTIIGVVIGVALSIRMTISAVNTANEIIRQIEE